ncbi:MAG: hypothetical protein SFU86_22795 [Pirellulaceae bacterium]|nr:hypothetical protein [Pirellulaceae bacterium]
MWIAFLLLAVGEGDAQAARQGDAWRAESLSFVVRNYSSRHDAREVAAHCEKWKARLQTYWCGQPAEAWSPRCEIVVHRGQREYLTAVGSGAAQTYGSSWLDFGKDKRVSKRQIDLRGDSDLGLAALAHEMTHVIVADLLDARQPPRWADEGMATLADTHDKQLLHERDLSTGLAARQAFRMGDLLTLDGYPHPSRVAAFYGQSVSVTAFLAGRDDPAKFVEFLRRALDHGHDRALREVYAIDGISHLERLWHEQRSTSRTGFHGLRLTLDETPQDESPRNKAAQTP